MKSRYVCNKYFLASIYIFRFVSNLTDIIAPVVSHYGVIGFHKSPYITVILNPPGTKFARFYETREMSKICGISNWTTRGRNSCASNSRRSSKSLSIDATIRGLFNFLIQRSNSRTLSQRRAVSRW